MRSHQGGTEQRSNAVTASAMRSRRAGAVGDDRRANGGGRV